MTGAVAWRYSAGVSLLETANTCTQKLRTRPCGAGGNRTPVRRRMTVRATTIPECVARWLPPRRVGRATRAPPRSLSSGSAVFHAVSGLSQLSPPLLLPGCGGPTPRAVAGRDDSRSPDWVRRRERDRPCWRLCWCPVLGVWATPVARLVHETPASKPISPVKRAARGRRVRMVGARLSRIRTDRVPAGRDGRPAKRGPQRRRRRAMARSASRLASRSAMAWRLSAWPRPRASASSTLARPPEK